MNTKQSKERDDRVGVEPKPDDVLARIAVSADELAGVIDPGAGSEIADAIARVLADRENQAA